MCPSLSFVTCDSRRDGTFGAGQDEDIAVSKEAIRVLNFLAGMPGGHSTLTRKDVHDLLLETGGNMLARGRLYDIVARDIGAGVYKISLTLANP